MSSQEALLFIPRAELLLPDYPGVDDETIVMELQDYHGGFTVAPAESLQEIFKVNFGFGIEFVPYQDDRGGTLYVTDSKSNKLPFVHHEADGGISSPPSVDGITIRRDETKLVVVGDVEGHEFLVYAGFCNSKSFPDLEPDSTHTVRINTNDNMPWVRHKLGYPKHAQDRST